MKELYIAPVANVIGYVASEKIAAEENLNFGDANFPLNNGITIPSGGDVVFPISLT